LKKREEKRGKVSNLIKGKEWKPKNGKGRERNDFPDAL